MASVSRILESRGVRPLKHKILVPVAEGVGRVGLERMVQRAPVDPGIRYSCYKSFDDLIDVELLKSLDAYVTSKIEEHEQEHDPIFGTGPMTLKASSPKSTGTRDIMLSRQIVRRGYRDYFELDNSNWTTQITGPSPMRLTSFTAHGLRCHAAFQNG
jgi:hypothetical protein